MNHVAVIVGSLRKDSTNRKLALALMNLGSDLFSSSLVDISDLPLINQDMEQNLPDPVKRMKEAVKAADAVLFVSPEYNRGMSAPLKNAIDWGSRPMNANSWSGKPAAIAGISPGPVGTAAGQAQFRSVATVLNMTLMSQPELYLSMQTGFLGEDGSITVDSTKVFLRRFLERFAKWIDKVK